MNLLLTRLCIVAVFSLVFLPGAVFAANNLVENPSFDVASANPTVPLKWTPAGWGQNTPTYSYPVPGVTDATAIRVTVTNYVSGDVKWFGEDVPVMEGKRYVYSDSFKSTIPSTVYIRYNTGLCVSAGTGCLYDFLVTSPATTNWKTASTSFVIPSGVVSITVFRALADNGVLDIDSVSISEFTSLPSPVVDRVPNNSLEIEAENATSPISWSPAGYGTQTALYEYLKNDGSDGTHSVRLSVSNYVSGDAKWMYAPQPVIGGETYEFSAAFKTNVHPRVFVQFTDAGGTNSYAELSRPVPAGTNWQTYTANVTVPTAAVSMTVFFALLENGWVQTDDYHVREKVVVTCPAGTHLVGTTCVIDEVPGANLIPNSSFNVPSTNPNVPMKWVSAGWGQNTPTYTYPVAGVTDATAIQVAVTNYVSGDAKWFGEDVPVTAGAGYVYRDTFKSTVPSVVYVRYNTGLCVTQDIGCRYEVIGSNNATTTWGTSATTFVIPSDVVSVNVFRAIAQNGVLTIDSVSLTPDAPVIIADLIPNGSLQQGTANDAAPKSWSKSGYGKHTANFKYIKNDGAEGTRSVKLTVTKYVDGDSKWVYAPQPVTGGTNYRFTANYKTNVLPNVVAEMTDAAGNISYLGMPRPEPTNTSWQTYSNEFYVPEGITSMTVFFYLNSNGWVQTDNYRLAPYSYVGFNRGLVTLTFDDGAEVNTITALPIMQSYNFLSTHCFATSFIKSGEVELEKILTIRDAGNEICSHTITHPDLSTLTPAQVTTELTDSQTYLRQITGAPVTNFASPYGGYNRAVINQIKPLYGAHRTVNEGFNSKDNLDVYRLRVQNMLDTTTLAEYQEWVTKAIADKTWLILVYHRVASDGIGSFDTPLANFGQQMAWLASSGVTVKTLAGALTEVQAQ